MCDACRLVRCGLCLQPCHAWLVAMQATCSTQLGRCTEMMQQRTHLAPAALQLWGLQGCLGLMLPKQPLQAQQGWP